MGIHKERVLALAAQGLRTVEIGEEIGIAASTARRILRNEGVKAAHFHQRTLHQIVADMTPLRAVDWLIDQLEILISARAEGDQSHEIDALGIHLTPSERRILMALFDAEGSCLTKDRLLTEMTVGRSTGEEPDIKIVDVYVHKIRRKLPASFGTIVTQWGRGYIFNRNIEP